MPTGSRRSMCYTTYSGVGSDRKTVTTDALSDKGRRGQRGCTRTDLRSAYHHRTPAPGPANRSFGNRKAVSRELQAVGCSAVGRHVRRFDIPVPLLHNVRVDSESPALAEMTVSCPEISRLQASVLVPRSPPGVDNRGFDA